MICEVADDPDMIAYAKSEGAKGITISGVCCTSNEVAMRRGIPMAGNFLQQENVVLTGACEAIVVDVQCIFPALGPLSKCFHTKFITTSPIAQMPDSDYIEFSAGLRRRTRRKRAIVKTAIDNFEEQKSGSGIHSGYEAEGNCGLLRGGNRKDPGWCYQLPGGQDRNHQTAVECITSGVIRGAVAMVGCNNPKIRPDYAHIELMKKLIENDIVS